MYRLVTSRVVYLAVCLSFALAIGVSVSTHGSIPGFGEGVLPHPAFDLIAQSPLPPPSPDDPWVTLAQ
ncbi:MAG: hypothetical protein ACE141_16260, partial [Bryobacteraceae bacterium]